MCGVYGSTWGLIYSWGGIWHHWGETGERDVAVALRFVLIEERRKNGEWRHVPGLINTFFQIFLPPELLRTRSRLTEPVPDGNSSRRCAW